MLVNRILCDYSPVLQKMLVSLYKFKIIKLVLRNMWGMFIRMNEAYSAFPNMTSLWTLRKTKLDSIFFLIFYLFVWMSFPST